MTGAGGRAASGVATGSAVIGDVLARSSDLIQPALQAAADTLPASMRRIVGYHHGWVDQHGRSTGAHVGKGIRPALVLLSAEATGGDRVAAVAAAVAVELVHDHSLLHDDVIDGDRTRRHRPTAWSLFGVGRAILAGDALLVLALDVLAASGHPASGQGARMLSAAVLDLLDGQSADIEFERRRDVELSECLRMARSKTGALFGCASALGALFGGGSPEQVRHLQIFGEHLGLAFQHVDDLLGIWGDPATTGKSIHSDLGSRKKTLPVVAALRFGTPAGKELAALYHRDEPLSEADLTLAAKLVAAAGGETWSRTQVDHLLATAHGHLRSAHPLEPAASDLESLAELVVRRDH